MYPGSCPVGVGVCQQICVLVHCALRKEVRCNPDLKHINMTLTCGSYFASAKETWRMIKDRGIDALINGMLSLASNDVTSTDTL